VVRTLSQIGGELGLATVGWEQYQKIKDDRLAELDESVFECAQPGTNFGAKGFDGDASEA